MNLAEEIELFLLSCGGWVPIEVICERFSVSDRQLRSKKRRPGLLAEFAMTDHKLGAIHYRFLPDKEFNRRNGKMGRHGVSELRLYRFRKAARRRKLVGLKPERRERFSGQYVLDL